MKVAGLILAAGGSTRLGSPKQLLVYEGHTLLRRTVETVLVAGCRPVVVVLGARAGRLTPELRGLDVSTVVNTGWERGMGTSVRLGLSALSPGPEIDAVLLSLCDQPLIGPEALRRLLPASACSIAAAEYDGTLGVPAVFGREHFAELAALPDAAGAKPILQRHAARVTAVPMPEAATDIDTREQYEGIVRTG